jgi:nicotinate-nucleotide pyrophosphorylase (carboxylating)
VQGTKAAIIDTRKTIPGLRNLQKYAVRMGGGKNHRFTLDELVLIKDNHIAAAGSITEAVKKARAYKNYSGKIEVETDSIEQVQEALEAKADIIMLDNFSPADVRKAAVLINGRAIIEVSGGVSLDTVCVLAEAGADLISVGALTHSAPTLDLGLDF